MTDPIEARGEWVGRSLAYVRMLIGAKAYFPSAKVAYETMHLAQNDPPPLGAVCFFSSEPWGNCGLYVGSGLVLSVTRPGEPVLWPLHDAEDYWGGPYVGWCPASALREAGDNREQS